MTVQAGHIIHVANRNLIDRLQAAGLGDARITNEVVRETGNMLVVDKVPTDPDFTFGMTSWDMSPEVEAMMTGRLAASNAANAGAGEGDPDGTEYKWEDCQNINILSPWKSAVNDAAGAIVAGVILPNYYFTRYRARFGVTDASSIELELAGGDYYMAEFAPVEEHLTGDGVEDAFITDEPAAAHRIGGAGGTTFKYVFGVQVDGVPMIEGTDFTVTGGAAPPGPYTPVTVTFAAARLPAIGAKIRIAYFTSTAQALPQALHPSTVIKPGQVRGRDIEVQVARVKLPGAQSAELEATVDSTVTRELGTREIIGRTITGRDCTGTVTIQAKDSAAFFDVLNRVTGVARTEVFSWLNQNQVALDIVVHNPKNPGEVLKTVYVSDAQFTPPGQSVTVNEPVDFSFRWESIRGSFSVFKGERP